MEGYLKLDGNIFLLTPVDSITRFNAARLEDEEAATLAAAVFSEGSEDVLSIPLLDDEFEALVEEDACQNRDWWDTWYEQAHPGAF